MPHATMHIVFQAASRYDTGELTWPAVCRTLSLIMKSCSFSMLATKATVSIDPALFVAM
jgi:hypothetical protein